MPESKTPTESPDAAQDAPVPPKDVDVVYPFGRQIPDDFEEIKHDTPAKRPATPR